MVLTECLFRHVFAIKREAFRCVVRIQTKNCFDAIRRRQRVNIRNRVPDCVPESKRPMPYQDCAYLFNASHNKPVKSHNQNGPLCSVQIKNTHNLFSSQRLE